MKDEKTELEERARDQAERSSKNLETWRREERLMASAVFELSVRIMDRKIQSQMMGATEGVSASSSGGSTTGFMNTQREALGRTAASPSSSSSSSLAGLSTPGTIPVARASSSSGNTASAARPMTGGSSHGPV
jgi:hypothetical protein